MKKFVKNRGDLVPFVYNGNVTQRLGLRKELLTEIRNIKGGLISEGIFNLVQTIQITVPQLFT